MNDVVLVVDEDTSRGQWPLGLVEEVERSTDGLVQAAKVRCKNTLMRRPVNKLVFLEHHQLAILITDEITDLINSSLFFKRVPPLNRLP